MKRLLVLLLVCLSFGLQAKSKLERPKLVVSIVVDQMRWDYLYRYYDQYSEDGFKRVLNGGFECKNEMINYIPSVTAVGHASIYTGSVPSIHGITKNSWWNSDRTSREYCVEDKTVEGVGATSSESQSSPRNLWTTTITDELRLATNFTSKVVGISIKNRASILPVGHNPTAAYWFDNAAESFVTSTYYMTSLPKWVVEFNSEKHPQKLMKGKWTTLLPLDRYVESTRDDAPWEGVLKGGSSTPTFDYDLAKLYKADKNAINFTPMGNTLTLMFAKSAVENYNLGQESSCDFLAINLASTDYGGHLTAPNSIEIEDMYLRLDIELGKFIDFIEEKVGKGNYLLVLTSDHGGAHAQGFLKEMKMPTGELGKDIERELNVELTEKFGVEELVLGVDYESQLYLNTKVIDDSGLNRKEVVDYTAKLLEQREGVLYAFDLEDSYTIPIPSRIKNMVVNGYNKARCGDIQIVMKAGWYLGSASKGSSHSMWNPYDTHLPLIFYGWNVKKGSTSRIVNITDIAPTLATMLSIQMPSGAIGDPIYEVIDNL